MMKNEPRSRRDVLKLAGSGMAMAAAASAAPAGPTSADHPPLAGTLDLSKVPVIDSHLHPYKRTLISTQYDGQRDTFTAAVLPRGDYPGKDAVRERLMRGYADLVWGVSRRTGYFNYVARTYGVAATREGFDSVLQPHIGSDAAFIDYTRAMLDRANIATLVVQSAEAQPIVPRFLAPADRTVWTWPVSQMAEPEWARQQRLTSMSEIASAMRKTMETAVANGCRGFKNLSAYYRGYGLTAVTPAAAEAALQALAGKAAPRPGEMGALFYDDPSAREHQKVYQDYLFKQIYLQAGHLERPIILHSAAILHPSLDITHNDPLPLYEVFMDPDIVRAGTQFVLIHGGYPHHNEVATFISQFPNVYVDVSHLAKYPAVLEEAYRVLLAPGPAGKIMHGSDSGGVPDETGYCAWNSRQVLARILTEYKTYYGWTQADIDEIAHGVLHRNAARVFRITT